MPARAPSSVLRRWWSCLALVSAFFAQSPNADSAEVSADLEVSGYADTDHVAVLTPALSGGAANAEAGTRVNADYLVDVVSAASVDIVSTASERWTELRHAGDLSLDYQPSDTGVTLSGGVSREPDFFSWSLGGALRTELDESQFTPTLGYSFSSDTAGRSGTPYSVYALRLERHTGQLGSEFVLNRSSRLALLFEVVFERGRQEKPYRYLPLFTSTNAELIRAGASVKEVNALRLPGRVSERLPTERERFALTGDWAWRGRGETLRINERLYTDSWGLDATTTDVSWARDLAPRFTLTPHTRLHFQSSVGFWRLAYVGQVQADQVEVLTLRSGDRELSALWTAALGLDAEFRTAVVPGQGWAFGAFIEGSQTQFLEALFVQRRWAALAGLSAGSVF